MTITTNQKILTGFQLNQSPSWVTDLNQWISNSSQYTESLKFLAHKITGVIDDIENYAEKKVHVLDLSFLSLTELPPSSVWSQLKYLNVLDLSGNVLSSESLENLKPLTSLQSINLNNNKELNEIPLSFIASQTNLNIFSASECGLTRFPAELAQSRQLRTIDLSDNQISELPEFFGSQMDNLSEMVIKNNRLTELPLSIKYIENLTKISLSGNPLTKAPTTNSFFSPENIEIEY